MEKRIKNAREILQGSKKVLVITGAGISAESGVPTFRGEGERWRGKRFDELATPQAFESDPREVWAWYLYRRGVVAQASPNAAHLALAAWADSRDGITLVTQNVDGLHSVAGSSNAICLHGSLWHNRCTACGMEREDRALEYPELPSSPCCGALERPAIVWFGESLNDDAFDGASEASAVANAVLIVGTSALVQPTTSFIVRARKGNGADLVYVNLEWTPLSPVVQCFLQGSATEIVPQLVAQ